MAICNDVPFAYPFPADVRPSMSVAFAEHLTKQVQVVSALGNSINAIVRMTGAAKPTVLSLLRDLGFACTDYHHRNVRNLRVRRVRYHPPRSELTKICY